MSRPTFAPSEATTVGALHVGDFLEVVPTQHGVRGVRFDLLVEAIEQLASDELAGADRSPWRARGSARGARVDAVRVRTRHGAYSWPADFTCTVRRLVPTDAAVAR